MKEGWEIKKLNDVCEVEYGTRVVRKRDGGTIYPVYGGGGATFFMDTFNREDCMVVARFAMSEQCTRFVKGKFFLNDSGLTVRPKNNTEILPDFLNLQIHFLNDHIYSLSRGTAQRNLDVPKFREINISYPKSLSEQQRIVSILDRAFAAIDRAKANAEKNLQNAKELFESYLQGVFENQGEGWNISTLGKLCKFSQGIQRDVKLQSEVQGENQVRFLRIIDFTQGGEAPRYIDNPGSKYILNENDVSLVRYGASTGFVCRGLSGALANNMFRVIPNDKGALSNDFLYIYLISPIFQNVVKKAMNGAAMPAISFNIIKDIPLPYPSSIGQKRVVKQFETVSLETQKLETLYQKKIAALDELKKSILQKAFAGELPSATPAETKLNNPEGMTRL